MTPLGAPALSLDTGGVVHRTFHCDHRLCPTCARRRAAQHMDRLTGAVAERFAHQPTLMTLTQRDDPSETVGQALDRILAAWARFRKDAAFREHVRGGWRSVEVTVNALTGAAHAHIHACVDAEWWPQADALASWREALGVDDATAGGCRLERLRKGIREAVKYTCKPGAASRWPARRLVELVAWMRGRRMLQTFGHMYGVALTEEERPGLEVVEGATDVVDSRTGEVVQVASCRWSGSAVALEQARRILAAEWELRHPWAAGRKGVVMVH